jgi:hypothetical protein
MVVRAEGVNGFGPLAFGLSNQMRAAPVNVEAVMKKLDPRLKAKRQ